MMKTSISCMYRCRDDVGKVSVMAEELRIKNEE